MDSDEIDIRKVRAGDTRALRTLAHRRGASVLAYCSQVCGPSKAPGAAAESFARMRAVLRDDGNLDALDADQLLRRATRHTAASAARAPQGPPPTGEITGRGTATCLDVAVLLAADRDSRLDDAQAGRLRAHIEDCARCTALTEITRRADVSYADPLRDTVGTDDAARFVAAMESVPADPPGVAAPPTESNGDPLTLAGAFPVLPELSDELPLGGAPSAQGAAQEAARVRSRPRWFPRVLRSRWDATEAAIAPAAADPADDASVLEQVAA